MDIETDKLIPMEDSTIAAILNDIDKHLPKVPKKKITKAEIAAKANLNVPNEYKDICGHSLQTSKSDQC
jgi:hypothetical protein